MKRFKGTKGSIIFIILVCMILGYYVYLSNGTKESAEENKPVSAVQTVLLRNLSTNYPPSPKEVVKYYSEISKCFYEGNYTEEELVKLAKKARELYDDELRNDKTEEQYLEDLKIDIETFKLAKTTISSFEVSKSTDVEEFSEDGFDFARLYCNYTLVQGSKLVAVNEVFILRKDEDSHYKIYGWDLAEPKENE